MASPQCEDGYTKIANELLDAMCRLDLTRNQTKVLLAVIRKTYGWNKRTDWIASAQIAQMTGLSRVSVVEALRGLLEKHVILRDHGITGIQKDYTVWCTDSGTVPISVQASVPISVQGVPKSPQFSTDIGTHKRQKTSIQKTERAPAKIISDQIHPAVRVYAELTGKQPRRGSLQYDSIARAVMDNNGNLSKWRDVVQAWLLADYRPTNVGGMLDWFTNGAPNHRTAGEKSQQQVNDEQAAKLARDLRSWNLAHGIKEAA